MIIELEKGKNYAVRFYVKDCFGRMKRPYKSGFPSRKAAQLWEAQERARLEGETFTKETITFVRLFKEWRGSLIKKDVSPRTLEKYDLYHSYIAEYLDHLPLQKINERICQRIIDMRLDSPATCAELRKLMSASFNYARKKRWMRENPMEFVDVPTYRPKKIPAYDFDDIRTLFSALRAENSKLYTPVLCACLFSATREEVCVLQETDIQRAKDGSFRLSLERALITVNGRSIIKTQKTENRRRSFIISAALFEENGKRHCESLSMLQPKRIQYPTEHDLQCLFEIPCRPFSKRNDFSQAARRVRQCLQAPESRSRYHLPNDGAFFLQSDRRTLRHRRRAINC